MSGAVHEGLVEHAILDKAFHALLEAIDGAGDVAGPFHRFADRLKHHIGSEDIDIARFADVDAEEAKGLLHEHAGLREAIDRLSARLDAGELTSKDVHELKLRFSLHEAREETGLYRWVAAH
jgi:hypothetical protein